MQNVVQRHPNGIVVKQILEHVMGGLAHFHVLDLREPNGSTDRQKPKRNIGSHRANQHRAFWERFYWQGLGQRPVDQHVSGSVQDQPFSFDVLRKNAQGQGVRFALGGARFTLGQVQHLFVVDLDRGSDVKMLTDQAVPVDEVHAIDV